MTVRQDLHDTKLFGVGSYTVKETARLISTSERNVCRWMKGYTATVASRLTIELRRSGHRSGQ